MLPLELVTGLPPNQSLTEIMPSREDQVSFRDNCIKHIGFILCDEVQQWSSLLRHLGIFIDPRAIPPHITERYYLPTYDQEQGSTRGNMLVLQHYFHDVLRILKAIFERIIADQRALDRSEFRSDHLSSIAVTSGLMHECLNFVENMGKNYWGDSDDSIGLLTMRNTLPNREEINLRKVDFYGWLRFLDAVLCSLIVRAAMVSLNIGSIAQLEKHKINSPDTFLLPSVDRLEADGIKKLRGNTVSGHAVLLTHDLMTLREMRHAIKHGHPSRVRRMLKYWAPMFYAGGNYNYAHETMELLHNIVHDWPEHTAEILEAGMIFNTKGGPADFLEGDMDVEHFNLVIKDQIPGVNASPALLEKIVPALGHIQQSYRPNQVLHSQLAVLRRLKLDLLPSKWRVKATKAGRAASARPEKRPDGLLPSSSGPFGALWDHVILVELIEKLRGLESADAVEAGIATS
ncbi:hypothetical protein B0H14DRAFT_2580598 [Mycena olivaceomarginata]|nr:hypothetical protein B0H14DRAFT_2580598 [Mycena olivaceomarginata]